MTLHDFLTSPLLFGTGAVFGLATFMVNAFTYAQKVKQDRLQILLDLRERIFNDPNNPYFDLMCDLVDNDQTDWSIISVTDRKNFLGRYEELIVIWNSGLINNDVAFYMCSYWAMRCTEPYLAGGQWVPLAFWNTPDAKGNKVEMDVWHWQLFQYFVKRMKEHKWKYRTPTGGVKLDVSKIAIDSLPRSWIESDF